MVTLDEISRVVVSLVRLEGAQEEQGQYKKRAKNTVLFYILAESVWQIKELIFYYYR